MLYKAFISYSHAADGKLAPALQRALHRIAKPWYRLRTMRVFRDQTNLATSPGLWTSIETALGEAEFFLYLASPAAAKSTWVEKEVEWWIENREPRTFLIVVTDGAISWGGIRGDFDPAQTNVLPPRLAGIFEEEPLYTDLRWARSVDHLSLRHSQFRAAALELAATLLGRPKDELDGEDVRQYRRTRRVAWSGVFALVLLFLAAVTAAYLATRQSWLATARALEARSEAVLPTNPELALLLAREAARFSADDQAEYALRQAVAHSPQRTMHYAAPGQNVVAAFAGPGAVVARTFKPFVAGAGQPAAVWSITSGRKLAELPLQAGNSLTLSRSAGQDQDLIVISTEDDRFPVYNAKTWKVVRILPGRNARFSRNGEILTATDGNRVRQWNVPSLVERKVMVSLPENYVVRDISRDGKLLLLSEDQEVTSAVVVEAESGGTLAKLPQRVLRQNSGFSPDGLLVVSEPMDREGFEIWNAQTGRLVRTLAPPEGGHIGWTTYVAFSPDGKLFVTGNRSGELHFWNMQTGKALYASSFHRNDVLKLTISSDSRTMLSVAADGAACLWDLVNLRCLAALGGKGDEVWDVGFAPDGHRFLTTHIDGTVRVWQRDTWYPNLTIPAEQAAVSEDGRFVLGRPGKASARVWDAERGKPTATLEESAGEIAALALSPDGARAAIAFENGGVGIWNTKTGARTAWLNNASGRTSAIAFDSGGNELATGGEDGKVRFWTTSDGSLLGMWPVSHEKITGLRFYPDGKRIGLALWENRGEVRARDTGKVLLDAKLDEDGVAEGIVFSPDGNFCMVFGDKFPQVWDLRTSGRVQTVIGHSDEVFSGAFGHRGRVFATGSGWMHARGEPPQDGNAVRIWDARANRELVSYRSATMPITALAFAKDDTKIIAVSMDGVARRYECYSCSPFPVLIDLASAWVGRELSPEERVRYVPHTGLWPWR